MDEGAVATRRGNFERAAFCILLLHDVFTSHSVNGMFGGTRGRVFLRINMNELGSDNEDEMFRETEVRSAGARSGKWPFYVRLQTRKERIC